VPSGEQAPDLRCREAGATAVHNCLGCSPLRWQMTRRCLRDCHARPDRQQESAPPGFCVVEIHVHVHSSGCVPDSRDCDWSASDAECRHENLYRHGPTGGEPTPRCRSRPAGPSCRPVRHATGPRRCVARLGGPGYCPDASLRLMARFGHPSSAACRARLVLRLGLDADRARSSGTPRAASRARRSAWTSS
jgi:hypothetical protein